MNASIWWDWCPHKKRETDTRVTKHREKAYKDTTRKQPFTSQEERSHQKTTLTTP